MWGAILLALRLASNITCVTYTYRLEGELESHRQHQ